ncbi:hypothetical protein [Rhodoferax sp. PAMC 29310]|nr:hypothetical protein [Rhodoferax sp. PAMC 29310]
MPLTLFNTSSIEMLEFWLYRVGGFVLLNLVDDPVWLALMFC